MQTIKGDLMKLRLFMMFALFPFLHATSYSAKLVSCAQDQIVLKSQDSEFRVSLFNTKITKEEGWQETCELLEDAKSIRFEIDSSSKIEEPVPVYLFADDKLVQEELMKQGHAYPMIRNPEYTYEKRLESAYDATQTMAKPAEVKTKSHPALVGPLYFGAAVLLWLLMLLYMLHRRKKKQRPVEKEQTEAEAG